MQAASGLGPGEENFRWHPGRQREERLKASEDFGQLGHEEWNKFRVAGCEAMAAYCGVNDGV